MSDERQEERQERTVNNNAGNQYDNPNQEVVGVDIVSGAGNEAPEAPPAPEDPEPAPDDDDDEITTGPSVRA